MTKQIGGTFDAAIEGGTDFGPRLDFLDRLREANVKRCVGDFKHPMELWSVAEWANAMQGECGEAISEFLMLSTAKHSGEAGNAAKKMLRFRDGLQFHNKGPREKYAALLANEIADMVLYADLLLASEGLSLKEALIRTFNNKSEEMGSSVFV